MYLTIISSCEHNWNALVPELYCIVTAPNREDLLRLTRESIAFALEDKPPTSNQLRSLGDLSADLRAELDNSEEIVFLEAAPI